MIGVGKLAVIFQDIDFDAGLLRALRLVAVEPEGRPDAGTRRQLRTRLEIAELLREARCAWGRRRQQAGLPLSVGGLARLDLEYPLPHPEGKVGLRIGESGIAEVAMPWCMGDPAAAVLPPG